MQKICTNGVRFHLHNHHLEQKPVANNTGDYNYTQNPWNQATDEMIDGCLNATYQKEAYMHCVWSQKGILRNYYGYIPEYVVYNEIGWHWVKPEQAPFDIIAENGSKIECKGIMYKGTGTLWIKIAKDEECLNDTGIIIFAFQLRADRKLPLVLEWKEIGCMPMVEFLEKKQDISFCDKTGKIIKDDWCVDGSEFHEILWRQYKTGE